MLLQKKKKKKDLARWGVFHQVLPRQRLNAEWRTADYIREHCRNQIFGCYICMSSANYF